MLYPIYGQIRYDSPPPLFVGKLYGNGFSIRNLRMNRPSPYACGLFCRLGRGAEVSNLDLRGVDITTTGPAGGLAAHSQGVINNVSVEGRVKGSDGVGGIVGMMRSGHIAGGYFSGTVTGVTRVGGIAGRTGERGAPAATIHFAHVRAELNGDVSGGIVGDASYVSSINSSHARVLRRSGATVGGLVGYQSCGAQIEDSYAQGKMTVTGVAGGVVGRLSNAHLARSYASIFLTNAGDKKGGAVGEKADNMTATINGAWRYVCTGTQTPSAASRLTQVYFDSSLTGSAGEGGIGHLTATLRKRETFTGWFEGGRSWRYAPGYMPVLNGLPRSVRVQ